MKICCLYRILGTVLNSTRPGVVARAIGRHGTTCPHCRADAAREAELEQRLRQAAPGRRVPPPPFLAGRIRRRLLAQPARATQIGVLRPIAATVAVAAVGLLAIQLGLRDGPGRPSAPSPGAEPRAGGFALALLDTPVPTPARLLELGGELDRPLETELAAVVDDARRAVRFLASNFLPPPEP